MTGNEEKPTPTVGETKKEDPGATTPVQGETTSTSQSPEDPVRRVLKEDYKYWEAVQKAREVKNNS